MSTSLSLEALKEALTKLLQTDRDFLRAVILEAIDGGRLLDAILADPQVRLRLATEMAKIITIPLNVATKEDIDQIRKEMATKEELEKIRQEMATKEDLEKIRQEMTTKIEEVRSQMATKEDLRKLEERVERIEKTMATKEDLKRLEIAVKEDLKRLEDRMATKEELKRLEDRMATKEDLKRLEDKMATKEQIERIIIALEEEAREVVKWLLKERGVECTPGRLWLDSQYEFDVYCTTGEMTVVGEAKVRASANTVEDTANRVKEAMRGWPERFPGRVITVLYCMIAMPGTVEKAQELGVWLIEDRKERTKAL
ncbi:MAG: hypothetical protein ACK4SY_07250 [Pyrobaculum sp.]